MKQKELFTQTTEEKKIELPENNPLAIEINRSGLEPETQKNLFEKFLPFYIQSLEWKEKAESLVVTDAGQKDLMKQAHDARLILKNIRTTVENSRKLLKEDSLRKGKAIDNIANTIKNLITPIEDHLEKQEKFIEIQEAERKETLKAERIKKLQEFEVEPSFYDLANMPDEQFDLLLESSKTNYNNKIQAAKRAEEEAIEKERIDKLTKERKTLLLPYWQFLTEDERVLEFGEFSDANFELIMSNARKLKADFDKKQEELRLENERLKKEKEEKESKEKADRDLVAKRGKELVSIGVIFNGIDYVIFHEKANVSITIDSSKISKLNDLEWQGVLSELKPALEKVKKAEEQEAREKAKRLQDEAAAKAIKEAQEKAEKEAKDKADAEMKAQKAAEKKDKLRPDKEKLITFANGIKNLDYSTISLKSKEAIDIFNKSTEGIIKIANLIIKQAEEL